MQQSFAPHTLRQWPGHPADGLAKTTWQIVKWLQRQWLPVNRITAEQFVGTFAGKHDFDVLARFPGDEKQRYQGRVGDGFIQIPDDLRKRCDELGLADDFGHMSRADGLGGSDGDVDLGEAFAFEARGERDQPRVVPHRQRCDCRRVDAAGQKRSNGNVGAHVFGHRIFEHLGDLVITALVAERWRS